MPRPAELRRSITALAERGRPHRAFIWPIDVVVSDEMPGFGSVMPRLEPGFISFAELLGRAEQPAGRVVLSEGGVITAHYLCRDGDYDTVVATVEAHAASAGRVVLRNAGTQPWVMRPDGEEAKTVEPGRRLAARAMTIDFGPATGRILGSQTAGTPCGGEGGR